MMILYTIGCPSCLGVERKMKDMNLEYEEIRDKQKMIERGFKTAPVLCVDDKIYAGAKAIFDYLKTVG